MNITGGSKPKVLVLGCYRQTLAALRSLRRSDYYVLLGITKGSMPPASFSRAVDRLWEHPPVSDTKDFKEALVGFAHDHNDLRILPVGDSDLMAVIGCRRDLDSAILCMPEDATVLKCMNKPEMCAAALRAGIPVPEGTTAHDPGELHNAIKTIGVPAAVKPKDSLVTIPGRKAVFIDNLDQLASAFPKWPEGVKELMVQRKIRGFRYNVDFASLNGKLLQQSHSKVLRVDTPDYSGVAVDLISIPAIEKLARYSSSIVREVNYSGVGLLQYLHEPAENEFYFLELNPRLGAPVACACDSGFDVPRWLMILSEHGNSVLPVERLKTGVRCNWATGDLTGLLSFLNSRQCTFSQAFSWLQSCMRSFVMADSHSTWSVRDPVPTLVAVQDMLVRILKNSAPFIYNTGLAWPRRVFVLFKERLRYAAGV